MEYIVCYDIGTSSIKCGLFDSNLKCLSITGCNYEVKMAYEGTAEAEPKVYIEGIARCTKEAIANAGIDATKVRSVCATTQGETLIPIDENGKELYKAIVWLDGRAEEEAAELKKALPDDLFKQKTGLPGVDGFTPLAKLLHVKRKMTDVYENTHKFLLLEDYITYCLTGEIVSEKSLLSSTGYFDLTTDDLWYEALDKAEIPYDKIPKVVEPGVKIGNLTKEAADMLGLTEETMVYAGAMDQLAGAIGCANYEIGNAHETTGTAMIVATTMGLEDAMARDHELTVYRHVEKDKFLLLAISRTATTVLKWFSEQFYSERDRDNIYEYLSEVVESGKVGANGLIMLPYLEGMMGGAGADAVKGTFWNIGLHNTREDFVRAIFEGVSYMLKDNLTVMFDKEDGQGELVSIGGASKSDIWCQIKADVTGREIVTMSQVESALFGCACIAAVGGGLYATLGDAIHTQGEGKRYIPNPENVESYKTEYQKYNLMRKNLEQLYREL